MRPVYFVKYFDKGSTILGGELMCETLGEKGIDARMINASDLSRVRDSILIFIKKGEFQHLIPARLRRNILVLDTQDIMAVSQQWLGIERQGRLKNRSLYHAVIFRSQKALADFGDGNGTSTMIYLPWNPQYAPNRVSDDDFRIAYLGDPRSFRYWDQLPDLPCIPEDRFFAEAPDYNCHISIRADPREADYKPTCKVSTAAACNANLITTRDAASLEVLGPDYPYYTEPDIDSVLQAIEKARATLGGEIWKAGLERMREVYASHDPETITLQYVDFLSRLDGSEALAS